MATADRPHGVALVPHSTENQPRRSEWKVKTLSADGRHFYFDTFLAAAAEAPSAGPLSGGID